MTSSPASEPASIVSAGGGVVPDSPDSAGMSTSAGGLKQAPARVSSARQAMAWVFMSWYATPSAECDHRARPLSKKNLAALRDVRQPPVHGARRRRAVRWWNVPMRGSGAVLATCLTLGGGCSEAMVATPGAGAPDVAGTSDATRDGRLDAAVIVIDERAGAQALGHAWARYLIHDRNVPTTRVHVVPARRADPRRVDRALARARLGMRTGGALWLITIGYGSTTEDGTGVLRLGGRRTKAWPSTTCSPSSPGVHRVRRSGSPTPAPANRCSGASRVCAPRHTARPHSARRDFSGATTGGVEEQKQRDPSPTNTDGLFQDPRALEHAAAAWASPTDLTVITSGLGRRCAEADGSDYPWAGLRRARRCARLGGHRRRRAGVGRGSGDLRGALAERPRRHRDGEHRRVQPRARTSRRSGGRSASRPLACPARAGRRHLRPHPGDGESDAGRRDDDDHNDHGTDRRARLRRSSPHPERMVAHGLCDRGRRVRARRATGPPRVHQAVHDRPPRGHVGRVRRLRRRWRMHDGQARHLLRLGPRGPRLCPWARPSTAR